MKRFALVCIALALFLTACSTTKPTPATGTDAGPATPPVGANATAEKKGADAYKLKDMATVHIAIASKAANYLPWFVGIDKGIYEKYNLKVDNTIVAGGTVATRALVAGEFQFVSGLPESFYTARSEGAPVKIIGSLNNQTVYTIMVTNDIKEIKDLKGKKVAVNTFGTGLDFQMRYLLKANGLEPGKDVEILQIGDQPQVLLAMKNGQIAAALYSPPTHLQAQAAGFKVLGKMSDYLKTYNHEIVATTDKLIKENPQMVTAFQKATGEAVEWIKANPKEAAEIGQKYAGGTAEEAKAAFDALLPTFPDGAKLNRDGVKWTLDTLKENKKVKDDLKLEDIVSYSFE